MKKVGSLKYGVLFKKAFCDPEIFKAFVKDFLNIDLKTDLIETEKSFMPSVGKVDVKFDLFAEDRENRVIVDIQHVRYPDHYHRFLYYHCIALIESIASAENYRPGMEVYTLVVLTSGDKHKKDIGIIDFDPSDLKGNKFGEIPHKIIYICPKYVNDETPESYRDWMLAINDSLTEEVDESKYTRPEIRKIFGLIEKDQISPKEYAGMKDEYSRQILIEEGIEKLEKAAVNLLKLGTMPDEQIAQIMGMTPEEIQKIKKDVK